MFNPLLQPKIFKIYIFIPLSRQYLGGTRFINHISQSCLMEEENKKSKSGLVSMLVGGLFMTLAGLSTYEYFNQKLRGPEVDLMRAAINYTVNYDGLDYLKPLEYLRKTSEIVRTGDDLKMVRFARELGESLDYTLGDIKQGKRDQKEEFENFRFSLEYRFDKKVEEKSRGWIPNIGFFLFFGTLFLGSGIKALGKK